MGKSIIEYETVDLDNKDLSVVIIDQTKLPGTVEIIKLYTAREIWDAIYLLKVRGALGHRRGGGLRHLCAGQKNIKRGFHKESGQTNRF